MGDLFILVDIIVLDRIFVSSKNAMDSKNSDPHFLLT